LDVGRARLKLLRRPAAALAFAVLLVLAFPFRAGELRFDAGSMAGWLALVPLVWLIEGLRPLRAAAWAGAAATAGFAGVLFWLFVVVHEHGHAPVWAGVLAVLAVSGFCGLHVGAAAGAVRWAAPGAGRLSLFVLPAAWVAAEHLRGVDLFGGFPWAFLGYAAHADPPLAVLASVGGVYGLSFVLALGAVLLARFRLVEAMALVALTHMAGLGLALAWRETPVAPVRAAIVQANVLQAEKWDPASVSAAFDRHLYLSELAAAAEDLDLVIWPETAVPLLLEREDATREDLGALARATGASLVIGGLGVERNTDEVRVYNSAFAMRDDGEIVDRYDKSVLVPFGEYLPLRALFGGLSAQALASGLAGLSDLTPGDGTRLLRGVPVLGGDHAAAVLICYEVIYPSVVRRAVRKGARLLLNLTNDAWYGRTSAPHQFLAISAMRSAEHGVPMLRAANTGVSAVVDARGRIGRHTEIFEGTVFVATVPAPLASPTLYTRTGDWVVVLSWGLLLAAGGARVVRGRRGDSGDAGRPSGSRRAGRGTPEASLTSTRRSSG